MTSTLITRDAVVLFRLIISRHNIVLNREQRVLGNCYARNEFRFHMFSGSCTSAQLRQFLDSWQSYLNNLSSSGQELTRDQLSLLSETQSSTLASLKHTILDSA